MCLYIYIYIYTTCISIYIYIMYTYIYVCIHVRVYVCSMCMCKCIQYVYVCVYACVYVSLPCDVVARGGGGVTPHTIIWGGGGAWTRDIGPYIHIILYIIIYIYIIYIILYIGLYTFRYPPRFYSHSTYFISYLPSPYLTIFLRPQVWCGLRPRLLNRKISSGQGRGTRKKGWCNLMQDGPPQL